MKKSQIILVNAIAAALLAGCSVNPKPMTMEQISAINAADRNLIVENNHPVTAPISLPEAVARALKHNLDYQVDMLKRSLAASDLEKGKYDMLPKLLAEAGYDWRNNYSSRYEAPYDDPTNVNRTGVTNVSIDPTHNNWDIGMSWSVLDFGTSYYTSKQNADRLLVAVEERRKTMHNLMKKVRVAYWEAMAAQRLQSRVKQTIADAEKALSKSNALTLEKLTSPEESLRYQRNLLENLRLLENVNRELSKSKIELSELMGIIPGTEFSLVEVDAPMTPMTASIEELEAFALLNNADVREQALNVRVAAEETRKSLLKMFPNISFNYGWHYDNDIYLVNDRWRDAGVSLSYNLFNLFAYSAHKEYAEKNEAVEQKKRMAVQMATVAKVHMSLFQYQNSIKQFKRSDEILNVDQQLEKIAIGKLKSDMAGEQRRISANVTTILSELRRYEALAKYEDALGMLKASLGVEPHLPSMDDTSFDDLTVIIDEWLKMDVNQKLQDSMKHAIEREAEIAAKAAAEGIPAEERHFEMKMKRKKLVAEAAE